jgi:SpoVK/Ycf46/Vps4 family AAA+-type ATPase
MEMLPKQDRLPRGLTLEKEARNLAALSLTPSLKAITSQVVSQWKKREVFKELERWGIYPANKLFFYGPPGNGKTTAAQWLAKELGVPLYRLACESLIVSFYGQTAAAMGEVMSWLSKQGPAVVLFDEIETVFPSRESNKSTCANESNSTMATFWQHLDRWTSPQLFVLATNMEDRVDSAILSRFEIKLRFDGPTADQCREVINYWTEVLHKYGASDWGPQLLAEVEQNDGFESFRDLWKRVKWEVTSFVNRQ